MDTPNQAPAGEVQAVTDAAKANPGSLQHNDGNREFQTQVDEASSPDQLKALKAQLLAKTEGKAAPAPSGPSGAEAEAAEADRKMRAQWDNDDPAKQGVAAVPPAEPVEPVAPDPAADPAIDPNAEPRGPLEDGEQPPADPIEPVTPPAVDPVPPKGDFTKGIRLKIADDDKSGKLALEYIKMAQRNGVKLTMGDALNRAKTDLGEAPAASGAPAAGADGKPATPTTVAQTDTAIADLLAKIDEANERVDLKEAGRLNREVIKLQDLKYELRDQERQLTAQTQQVVQSQAVAEYNAAFDKSSGYVTATFPEIADVKTKAGQRWQELDRWAAKENPDLYADPNKPRILADMVAREMRIAPKTKPISAPTGKPGAAAAVKPLAARPPVPVVASGSSRTEARSVNTTAQQRDAMIDSVSSIAELEDARKKLGL